MEKIRKLLQVPLIGLIVIPIGSVTFAATSSISSSGPLIVPSDPEQSTTLPQRLTQRKSTLKLQLSNAQLQSITKNCSVAQTGLQDIKTRDQTAAQNRTQIYSDLATQLATAINNLDNQSIDTTSLKAAQTQFDNAINKYLSDSIAYKTTMDDAVVMDCASDPNGFEATIQSARSLRTQLANDASQIKSTIPQLVQALATEKEALIKSSSTNGRPVQ